MITFTASGYIEVWKDATVVSRHRIEREAIESCAAHGSGRYTLTYPPVSVVVDIPIATVEGQINGAVYA